MKDPRFLSDPDALRQKQQNQSAVSSSDVLGSVFSDVSLMFGSVFSDVSLMCGSVFLCVLSGLRQSVQPAGHPAHRRHELQAAPRSLDVCKVSS